MYIYKYIYILVLGRSSIIINAYSVASFIMIYSIMKLVIDINRKKI